MNTVPPQNQVSARGYWLRRGFAFLLDFNIAITIVDLSTNWIVHPVPAGLLSLLSGPMFFAYWAGCETFLPATPGMALLGLRVVGDSGVRPGVSARLQRAAMIAALFGIDTYEILGLLTAAHAPEALRYVQRGFMLGYFTHAAAAASRKHFTILHDALSHTRVVLIRKAMPVATETLESSLGRPGVAITAVCVALSVAAGIWTANGPRWDRLWTSGRPGSDLERSLEDQVTRQVGIRSEVTSRSSVRWATGQPRIRVAELEAKIPFGAFTGENANQTFHAMAESLQVDPKDYDRLEFVVSASLSGLLRLNTSTRWRFAHDSVAGSWRLMGSGGDAGE